MSIYSYFSILSICLYGPIFLFNRFFTFLSFHIGKKDVFKPKRGGTRGGTRWNKWNGLYCTKAKTAAALPCAAAHTRDAGRSRSMFRSTPRSTPRSTFGHKKGRPGCPERLGVIWLSRWSAWRRVHGCLFPWCTCLCRSRRPVFYTFPRRSRSLYA